MRSDECLTRPQRFGSLLLPLNDALPLPLPVAATPRAVRVLAGGWLRVLRGFVVVVRGMLTAMAACGGAVRSQKYSPERRRGAWCAAWDGGCGEDGHVKDDDPKYDD